MKIIINSIKKQSKLITGIFIGLVIATTISYGVNNIQSSSVSYTKDGKTMSVKQAIDDLIVKVNKKGSCGVFNITLKEQNMSLTLEKSTYWLKSFVDEALKELFTNVSSLSQIDNTELLKLQNGEYTWSSNDTSTVIIDGTTVTPKKLGSVVVIATTSGGATVKIPLKISEAVYLADEAQVGDYVAYDAGVWTSTAEKPTSQGQFGGYTAGQNKARSVDWCYQSKYINTLKGWRVFSLDTSTKTVTLVHAGEPECYYHEIGETTVGVANLNNRATSQYLNSNYAQSAHNMTYNEALSITGSTSYTTNDLRYIGPKGTTNLSDTYWLATPSGDLIKSVYEGGHMGHSYHISAGIRPVVVLKSNILTTGKGKDVLGQEAWTLVKP